LPYWQLFYHLVWGTRKREPIIGADVEMNLRRFFQMTVADSKMHLHAIGFMPDHVHLVASIPPQLAISEAVRRLKGAASHGVNAELRLDASFGWQPEYGVLSFGEQALDRVIDYVVNQRQIHETRATMAKLERLDASDR
jgi:REP element-mobilizing transposase RayT